MRLLSSSDDIWLQTSDMMVVVRLRIHFQTVQSGTILASIIAEQLYGKVFLFILIWIIYGQLVIQLNYCGKRDDNTP